MIFTIFLLLYILICHALCFREESGWSLQICSNFSFWMSQCVENSSSQLVLLSSMLFSVVSILFIPLLCLVCIIYILCQQSLHTVRLNSHNTANRKNLTTRSHRLFQGNSNWCALLVSQVWQEQPLGERQDDVLVKPHSSFVYDKPFYKDQLYIYRLGNRHRKERQSNSFSIEWRHGFQPCSETHCLVLVNWAKSQKRSVSQHWALPNKSWKFLR